MRLPAVRTGDAAPILAVPILLLAALPAMGFADWLTLSASGLAMGMLLFLMASGLTLIFGLMDVLNFAHGAFVGFGAFIAASVWARLPGFVAAPGLAANLLALVAAGGAAALVCGGLGLAFERVVIRRVYGAHLRQILITVGAMIVAEQMSVVIWGPDALTLAKPASLASSFIVAGGAVEKFRLVAAGLGLAAFLALRLVLARTRIGLVVRAGVEDREMVEALGYRVRRLFVFVFAVGTALAGVGGAMWAVYAGTVTAALGGELTVLLFTVVVIGGLGSVSGSFLGALLVGLITNYVGFLAPKLALLSNVALMAAVLLWRPRGLLPLVRT